MKALFDDVSAKCSQLTTQSYSTSFSLGIRFLDKNLHKPIYAIYGFVRFADEIVDSFHDYPKQDLMDRFRKDTVQAIQDRISLNPILNSFQQVVHDYQIEWELIDTFLKSMEMDLEQRDYTEDSYKQYILGSAEVVGLMCLRVFVQNDGDLYDILRPYAMSLGSAFQKINFLRDIQADYVHLGRTYFPEVDMENFDVAVKKNIERDIESDFKNALIGIKLLPTQSKMGVYLAFVYYKALFSKIKALPADRVLQQRIRIPNLNKVGLIFQCYVRSQFNLL